MRENQVDLKILAMPVFLAALFSFSLVSPAVLLETSEFNRNGPRKYNPYDPHNLVHDFALPEVDLSQTVDQ